MKTIVVCYKWVLDDADIRVNASTRALETDRAAHKINEYDRNGIEAGVRLKSGDDCRVIGVCCGADVSASLKDALSRGLDEVCHLSHTALEHADSAVTARVLATMIRTLGPVDIVICSEGSSDEYAQQIGPRLAVLLQMASVTAVASLQVTESGLHLSRKLNDGVEQVSVAGPVVLSVSPALNDAPIPSLKQILAAKKKLATQLDIATLGLADTDLVPQMTNVSVLAPVVTRRRERLNPTGVSINAAAEELVRRLTADGVI